MAYLLRILFCLLARICIIRHKPLVIGITGSFGKTTARHIITEILLENNKAVYTSEGNYNGEWGLALSVLQVRSGGKSSIAWLIAFLKSLKTIVLPHYPAILVLEYGIDHKGEMKIQTDIVEPNIALFTTLAPSHLDGFDSADEYFAEKEKLLSRKKKNTFAIGNLDDIHQKDFSCQKWYGEALGDMIFSHVSEYCDRTEAKIMIDGKITSIETPILGKHHIGLIAGSLCVALEMGLSMSDSVKSIAKIQLPDGRGNVLRGINNSLIVDGTYNGGYEPIVAGVRMITNLARDEKREIIAIIGDMRELGEEENMRHEALWNVLRKIPGIYYIFVGEISQRIIKPLVTSEEKKYTSFHLDARSAGDEAAQMIRASESLVMVFAKGSQNTIYLEEALKKIIVPEEREKLVRQDSLYMNKKEHFWKKFSAD